MNRYLFALSLGFGLCVMAASAGAQQMRCADRTEVIEKLHKKYGETRQSIGLNRTSGVVETYASLETGTWTILLTLPNGQACMIAAGENFERLEETLPTSGEDA
ncbi:MAG: hypothetical protein AAF429_15595 [Pseudomonadota bacterium]